MVNSKLGEPCQRLLPQLQCRLLKEPALIVIRYQFRLTRHTSQRIVHSGISDDVLRRIMLHGARSVPEIGTLLSMVTRLVAGRVSRDLLPSPAYVDDHLRGAYAVVSRDGSVTPPGSLGAGVRAGCPAAEHAGGCSQ